MSAVLELAERCERATEPDREMDVDIALALSLTPPNPVRDHQAGIGWLSADCAYGVWKAPKFTASIDAALTLVPEGFTWSAGCSRFVPHQARVHLSWAHGGWDGNSDHSRALAICAAALRARAASVGTRPQGGDSGNTEAPFTSGAVPRADAQNTGKSAS